MLEKISELKFYAQELYHLESILSLLFWDQATYMPQAAALARGKQRATLGGILQQKKTDPRLGLLLSAAEQEVRQNNLPYHSNEASLCRAMLRQYDIDRRVPADYINRMLEHSSKTEQAWLKAKEAQDFKVVEPFLSQTLALSQEYAHFFSNWDHIADPLIARSDYGWTVSQLKPLFTKLRQELLPLISTVLAKQNQRPPACLNQCFPKKDQLSFGEEILAKLGFDFERGRQDLTAHPFAIKMAHEDVRITTRVAEDHFSEALFSSIHEMGHALYELGIDKTLEGTILHQGTSSGVHESQSRLWENIVGRSLPFWEYFYPLLQTYFPKELSTTSLPDFYQAINTVKRSLIRTNADELTYNLHVIIRFDLEVDLLTGALKIKDLPEAWRERYREDLGVLPEHDSQGVLQDIHWYFDLIGGQFQCYTLGNILSAQFFKTAAKQLPNLSEQMRTGNFSNLKNWLDQNIYRHGSKFDGPELIRLATGDEGLKLEPYLEYLSKKFGAH
ncbi:MAG: hypothetical protein RLZ12_874 [Bacillota bacterium]|jgi:carboxypeptidase Taq